jgi:hypothetical protein
MYFFVWLAIKRAIRSKKIEKREAAPQTDDKFLVNKGDRG